MKRQSIDFRELLERVLPLDELPSSDRLQIQRVLHDGVASEIERAALDALQRLERRGIMKRIAVPDLAGEYVQRFQPRDGVDLITVELPRPLERDGVLLVQRSALPTEARAELAQVRLLLRLDDPWLAADPREGGARLGLMHQLNQVGRAVLGATELRFVAAEELEDHRQTFDRALALQAFEHPDTVVYCADTWKAPALEAEGRKRRLRSIAMACVRPPDGEPRGILEIQSTAENAFTPENLALVALLADCTAGILERASRIEKLVFIDPLTGAYNRSYFDLQMGNEMARAHRERGSLALCIVDIDDFKSFNTTFGYEAGNQVLVQVAQALKNAVRPFDTVARWGGEEFAVLLTAPVHGGDVATISERLRSTVERSHVGVESLDRQTHRVVVTVSIGVALFPDHQGTAADLWRAANQALLEAKRPPKNQVIFYRPTGPAAHRTA